MENIIEKHGKQVFFKVYFFLILNIFLILDYYLQEGNEHIKKIVKISPMNISKMTLLYAILMVSAVSCQDINSDDEIDLLEENMVNFNHEHIRNGKIKNAKKLPPLFNQFFLSLPFYFLSFISNC